MSSQNTDSVRVMLYYHGSKVEGRRGVYFEGEKRPTRIKRNSTIEELHQRIHQKLRLKGNQSISQITARLWQHEQYISMEVVDDEDVEMLMEFFNQSRKDLLELYVEIAGAEDVVLPVRLVELNSPRNPSLSVAPVVNNSEEDENDPTWVMNDDYDDDDDENMAMEERLLAEDASASEGDEDGHMRASQIPEYHSLVESQISQLHDRGSAQLAQHHGINLF